MIKEFYSEVVCNYNNGEGYWTVDAWKTSDENEEGSVIAAIHEKTGDVFYVDNVARVSPMAQEVIQAKVKEIKEGDNDSMVVELSNGDKVKLKEVWTITKDDSYSEIEVYDNETNLYMGSFRGSLPDDSDPDFDLGECAKELERTLKNEGIV